MSDGGFFQYPPGLGPTPEVEEHARQQELERKVELAVERALRDIRTGAVARAILTVRHEDLEAHIVACTCLTHEGQVTVYYRDRREDDGHEYGDEE